MITLSWQVGLVVLLLSCACLKKNIIYETYKNEENNKSIIIQRLWINSNRMSFVWLL